MRVALLGCGFAADYYVTTLANHPELELVAVCDRDEARARHFAHAVPGTTRASSSIEELLADDRVELVINATNPEAHFSTTRACLLAGRHVYSEKPLATRYEDALALVELAEQRELSLSGAPCNLLSEAAQTTWKALRDGLPGAVRLVYAELDEGPGVYRDSRAWRSRAGVPWPFDDELRTGVTLEHAGYYVSWLLAFFGPVRAVTTFGAVLGRDLAPEVPADEFGSDFTVSCLEFASGVVARITCGLIAQFDHSLRIFGDRGMLSCRDGWDYGAKVVFEPEPGASRRDRLIRRWRIPYHLYRRLRLQLPLVREPAFLHEPPLMMDFARGVAEQATAIRERRTPRLSARFCLHLNEVVLAMQPAAGGPGAQVMRSTFADPPTPMPWARAAPNARRAPAPGRRAAG